MGVGEGKWCWTYGVTNGVDRGGGGRNLAEGGEEICGEGVGGEEVKQKEEGEMEGQGKSTKDTKEGKTHIKVRRHGWGHVWKHGWDIGGHGWGHGLG